MAPSRLFFTILVQFCTTAFSICHNRTARFPAIFTFGDSFVDSGNNNFLLTLLKANHPPYGQSFPGKIATGRFSDGKLFTDFVASSLGIKDIIPPFLQPNLSANELRSGVSFASGGSGYDDLTTILDNVISVSKQVEHFKDYVVKLNKAVGEVAAKNIVKASLVVVAAGTSDLLINFYGAPTRQIHYGLTGYQDFLQRKTQDFIKALYAQGIRKIMIAGLPPIGCLPIQIATKLKFDLTCVDEENSEAQSYNQKLISLLSRIEPTLPGIKLVHADIYAPIIDMIVYPAKYGLSITNRGCCGVGLVETAFLCKSFSPVCPNPAHFLFWDSVNPTEVAHWNVAQFLKVHALPQFSWRKK
ncbi:hypothetical protein ACH5RR_020590 [Cinchona calisaya]|uniref:GDSL esterase/lipase n=1 Tax=Cinchona calisaya TaxID=153742 RepID=A0ABD2ZEX7_9GENT